MTRNWDLRSYKRALSVFEKSTLPTNEGRALILPGEPDGEIEELINVGYDNHRIVGVEQEQSEFYRLNYHYRDQVMLFHDEVGNFMSTKGSPSAYSYVHLDYCGHFNRTSIASLAGWQRILAPVSRVRVSVFRGRRSAEQFAWEEMLFRDVVLSWCELGANADRSDMFRWIEFDAALTSLRDDTPINLVMMMMLQLTFGIQDVRSFTDELRCNGSFVPMVEGRHRITNIQRYCYSEPGSPNHMYTMWFDAVPLDISATQRLDEQWALDEVASLMENLTYATPYFHPALAKE